MPIHRSYVPIEGTSGNDTIIADFAAADALYYNVSFGLDRHIQMWDRTINGGGGNDLIRRDRPGDYVANPDLGAGAPAPGNVVVYSGAPYGLTGNDTISYQDYAGAIEIDLDPGASPAFARHRGPSVTTIHGTDILNGFRHATGTQSSDILRGSDDDNRLTGLGGHDSLFGEGGADTLDGGSGNDTLFGGAGADSLSGGEGRDELRGNGQNDTLRGGGHHDRLYGDDGNDSLLGEDGNDILIGGMGHDTLIGGAGADSLDGGHEHDLLILQASGRAHGGEGNDTLNGSSGADRLTGDGGEDSILAGNGADTLDGGNGSDVLDGGSGTDTAIWSGATVTIELDDAGNGEATQGGYFDQLFSIERVVTGNGADLITFGSQHNMATAGGGADTVFGDHGNDTLYGGDGADSLHGGVGHDVLAGQEGANRLDGAQGNDSLVGGSGNDVLFGGSGTDYLYGGGGRDGFLWRSAEYGCDTIADFVIGQDWIGIDDILLDPPEDGEGYFGKVVALPTDMFTAVVLLAETPAGWLEFARLTGHTSANAVNDAIADGRLFTGPAMGGGADGVVW